MAIIVVEKVALNHNCFSFAVQFIVSPSGRSGVYVHMVILYYHDMCLCFFIYL